MVVWLSHRIARGAVKECVRACVHVLSAKVTFGQIESQEAGEADHCYTGVEVRRRVTEELVHIWKTKEELYNHLISGTVHIDQHHSKFASVSQKAHFSNWPDVKLAIKTTTTIQHTMYNLKKEEAKHEAAEQDKELTGERRHSK